MEEFLPGGIGWLDGVIAAHRGGRTIALLFDYDGTLTPIVSHPSLARLPGPTRYLLAALRDSPGVTVGVVSGRSLDEVRELIGLQGVFYAGSGGLELDLFGDRVSHPESSSFREASNGLMDELIRVVSCYPGAWVEQKQITCSLHFRNVPPLRTLAFQREVFSLLASRPQIQCRVVSRAIELAPASGWDKGTAVAAVVAWLGGNALPVYAGDAENDLEAMVVTACLGGLAVGIGPDAPALATHRLDSPEELAGVLGRLVSAFSRDGVSTFAPQTPPVVEDIPAPTEPSNGPHVLVVDADPQERSRTATGLRSQGWQVWEAGALNEALDDAHRLEDRLSAAVVDLQMPGLQGWRVLRGLAEANPAMVRCATSTRVGARAEVAFRGLCDTPLFVRPFEFERLSAALSGLLAEAESSDKP